MVTILNENDRNILANPAYLQQCRLIVDRLLERLRRKNNKVKRVNGKTMLGSGVRGHFFEAREIMNDQVFT